MFNGTHLLCRLFNPREIRLKAVVEKVFAGFLLIVRAFSVNGRDPSRRGRHQ
jgi:hypothetical protein